MKTTPQEESTKEVLQEIEERLRATFRNSAVITSWMEDFERVAVISSKQSRQEVLREVREGLPKEAEKYRGFPLDPEEKAENAIIRRVNHLLSTLESKE